MIHTDEDDEFDRIERENKMRNKSSGMECCTYDCIQGRDCPVRKQKYNMAVQDALDKKAQNARELGLDYKDAPK